MDTFLVSKYINSYHEVIQVDMDCIPAESYFSSCPPGITQLNVCYRVTLDTPMNRKWMPDADQTTWTPLEFVAE